MYFLTEPPHCFVLTMSMVRMQKLEDSKGKDKKNTNKKPHT